MKRITYCKQCGTKIEAPCSANRKFCSRKCYSEYRSDNYSGKNAPRWKGGDITLACEQCHNDFAVKKSESDRRFCSRECSQAFFIGNQASGWRGGRVELICEQCEKPFDVYQYNSDARFCSRVCMHTFMSGENHPYWKGGQTDVRGIWKQTGGNEWRRQVFKRDNFTCMECNEFGGTLNAHHILPFRDYPEPQFSSNVDNGITLCIKCHQKTMKHEYDFFSKYFDLANGVGEYTS